MRVRLLVIDTGGHASKIQDVTFTRDGKRLVSAGDDKVVRVWDTAKGETIRVIRGQIGDGDEGKIYAAALSPDERYLAVGGWLAGTRQQRDAVRLHDFASGNVLPLLQGHTDVIYDLAFSPNGERVVSGSWDDTLRLWNAETGELMGEMKGHEDNVPAVAFSPDGRYIASGSWDKTVRLWDGQTGRSVKKLGKVNRGLPAWRSVRTAVSWSRGCAMVPARSSATSSPFPRATF